MELRVFDERGRGGDAARMQALAFDGAGPLWGGWVGGKVVNAVTEKKQEQLQWKRTVALWAKERRGAEPWDPLGEYAVTVGFALSIAYHHRNAKRNEARGDLENFVKPVLDALAAGLFCPADADPLEMTRFHLFDDAGLRPILLVRLPDAATGPEEGVLVSVSRPPEP